MQELIKRLPDEMKRLQDMTNTFQGLQNLISIYENAFNEKYEHGVNVVYEIARVNILRKLTNKKTLC